jgi:hypothetical protein
MNFEWDENKHERNEKPMKRVKPEMEDDLRSEYDLKSLRVRSLLLWTEEFWWDNCALRA